jgi:hypothetical protein
MTGLRFYMHDGPRAFRFELAGNLAGVEVGKLEQAWRTASSTMGDKTLAVDVTFLASADQKGRDLLFRWWRAGARLVATSAASKALVESITGVPYMPADAAVGPTFDPRFTTASLRAALLALVFAATLLFPAKASASELKQETLDAWDQYLHGANALMLDRTGGDRFLWAGESPERLRRVHGGEVVVSPMRGKPTAVPSGLIHHWIGAAFIPGARIEDVLAVVRNYDRYADFYRPLVIDAKTLSRKAREDRFSVVMTDKAMFMKRALDSEYQSRFAQVDNRRWYSVALTTRVQELEDQRRIPDGEGSGYIWRLCTISRYEERDGGAYMETEAIALSRPIPMTLHWVVDPIVRRVSRTSLTTSLEQTREATLSASEVAGIVAGTKSSN